MVTFSLFENDQVDRLFQRWGCKSPGIEKLLSRSALLILITWTPILFLAMWEELRWGGAVLPRFLNDIAAYGQFWIGMPLFVLAEDKINAKTKLVSEYLLHGDIIHPADRPRIRAIHRFVNLAKGWQFPELIALLLGYLATMGWIIPELYNGAETWHAVLNADGTESLTLPGAWSAFVAVPLLNFWWLRWIWKIALWVWYLRRVSDFQLRLVASHPDRTGGLAFLTAAQTSFGYAIFAFGLGIVAASVGYKLEVEGAPLTSFAVYGPIVGFVVLAPLSFLLPLFMFTDQLRKTKTEALFRYDIQAGQAARLFEREWFAKRRVREDNELLTPEVSGMADMSVAYETVRSMRVVPFDAKSVRELMASTVGPLLPMLFHLFQHDMPKPLTMLLKVLGLI